MKIPSAYITPCEVRPFRGSTYGDLILYTKRLQSQYKFCAFKIEKIREWSERMTK